MSTHPARLLAATRKGLFTLDNVDDRIRWRLGEPQFLGHIIQHAVLDPRDGQTLLVAAKTGHLGPTIFRSTDAGRTFTEAARPPAFDKAAPGTAPRVVSHTFWLTPGHASEPGVWWAGTSPQALWRSDDAGQTWSGVRGFNDHPDYSLRTEDPQGGTPDGPVLHSILVDPRDARHMYLGLSGGGVYESLDHGGNWSPLNDGMATVFSDPDADPDDPQPQSMPWKSVGPEHDPHCVQLHPLNPDILYQQNHCGIYRLQRPATRWTRIGRNMPTDVGDIGFVIGVHPRDTATAWVFPMDGTDVWPRTSPGGRPAAWITRDDGRTWQRQANGFPDRGWFTIKRQGMAVDTADPIGLYLGTTSGEVWATTDEGASWRQIAAHLPEIYALELA
ncbi:MAG: glycosyl hydrolase [Pseudomonadales bacterium]|nr:glycosyl hydrolase [Pseudomonadales bacterium]MCP5184594.1 glycosyl hydrolase [Pseudomonadales bacterium]